MSTISDIAPQKSQKDRFNVFVDGKFSFALSAIALARAGLKINQEISPEKIGQLIRENEFGKLFDKTLKFLSFRPRSEFEIRQFLEKKQKKNELVSDDAVEMVIEKLKKINQINDIDFARFWIESRNRFRPKGKRLLKIELIQKGLDKNLIEEILGELIEKGAGDLKLAQKAIAKKVDSFKKLPPDKLREKVAGFLARRGFDWETIKSVVDSLLSKE